MDGFDPSPDKEQGAAAQGAQGDSRPNGRRFPEERPLPARSPEPSASRKPGPSAGRGRRRRPGSERKPLLGGRRGQTPPAGEGAQSHPRHWPGSPVSI
ncbi:translation initiation factor IF-2-like isoform X2 [Sturnira hondurensis]|uniref:translation initiation factor IF-2-like isoform X2 n=1 Tax=Sturnira hondurensis TaxID=192404 RepID=UPI0018799959|nr:translation initiation factor IF-2-like isoform X2 [Sturnira hondurensis]